MSRPKVRRCPDKHCRRTITGFASAICDYPDQVAHTSTVQGWCPKWVRTMPESTYISDHIPAQMSSIAYRAGGGRSTEVPRTHLSPMGDVSQRPYQAMGGLRCGEWCYGTCIHVAATRRKLTVPMMCQFSHSLFTFRVRTSTSSWLPTFCTNLSKEHSRIIWCPGLKSTSAWTRLLKLKLSASSTT